MEAEVVDTSVQEQAAACAEELPGAELTHPFGADWDVWKARGKVFMLLSQVTGEPMVILKANPADAHDLKHAYETITPGYHMNKKHWITVAPGVGIDPPLIDDLVTESYLLVIEKLPKRQRPVDPATFGRG